MRDSHVKNPDGSYLSQEQIVNHLLETHKDQVAINYILSSGSKWHVCMYIRAAYGLWNGDNPYVIGHPDDYSEIIFYMFVARLLANEDKNIGPIELTDG